MFLSHVSPGDVDNSVVIVALCMPRGPLIIGRSEVSSRIYNFIHVRVLNQYFLSFIVQTTPSRSVCMSLFLFASFENSNIYIVCVNNRPYLGECTFT